MCIRDRRVAARRDGVGGSSGHERPNKPLVVAGEVDVELVAVLELGDEVPRPDARVDRPCAVDDVFAVPAPRELSDALDVLRSWAEPQLSERSLEVEPPGEADLRVEVLAHGEILGARTVAIGIVLEAALIALIVADQARGRRARPVH